MNCESPALEILLGATDSIRGIVDFCFTNSKLLVNDQNKHSVVYTNQKSISRNQSHEYRGEMRKTAEQGKLGWTTSNVVSSIAFGRMSLNHRAGRGGTVFNSRLDGQQTCPYYRSMRTNHPLHRSFTSITGILYRAACSYGAVLCCWALEHYH